MTRRASGGVVLDEDGIVLMAGPHPLPFLINCVARVEQGLAAGEVLARARAFFAPRHRGFTVFALAGTDDDLVEAAEDAGLIAFGEPAPLMAIDEPPASVDIPAGMRIEAATTAAQVAEISAVCADAYAVYGMPADVPPAVLSASVVLANHSAAVLAYDSEGAVATAQALATHGAAYLTWVGTRQRSFGRGAGAAVTQAATLAGFELGARLATLMASKMGAPVYRRLGWTDVGAVVSRVALTSVPE